MTEQNSTGGRKKRRWFRALALLLVVVLVVVSLLPMLVGGLAKSSIEKAISSNVNGKATIQKLSLGWLGGQSVTGFKLDDPAGKNIADVNVQVKSGLLKLLLSRSSPIEITVSGTVAGEVLEDGSLSFTKLAKTDVSGTSSKPSAPSPKPSAPFKLPSIPPLKLDINTLDFSLTNVITKEVLSLDDLAGSLSYLGGSQPITVNLKGKTSANQVSGEVDVNGQIDRAFDADGAMTLRGASAKIDVNIKSVALPMVLPVIGAPAEVQAMTVRIRSDDITGRIAANVDTTLQVTDKPASTATIEAVVTNLLTTSGALTMQAATANINVDVKNVPLQTPEVHGEIQTLHATVVSDDLTQLVKIAANGNAQLEGHPPSTLLANLEIAKLFTPDGKSVFAVENTTGTISGKAIPTPVLQPFLSSSPIVAARDFGPTLDMQAEFSSGTSRDVKVNATGTQIRLEVVANVAADRSIQGSKLALVTPTAHPDLVRGFTELKVDKPVDLAIELTKFSLPPLDPDSKSYPLPPMAMTGTVTVKGPNVFDLGDSTTGARPLEVRDIALRIESPKLSDHLVIEGQGTVDGAVVTINERITNLFDASGRIAAFDANPSGTININPLTAATLAKFVAPDQKPLLEELIGAGLNAGVTSVVEDGNLKMLITAKSDGLDASITALRKPSVVSVSSGTINLTATPNLVAAAQVGRVEPVVLTAPATAKLDMQPVDIARPTPTTFALTEQPLKAKLTVDNAVLEKVPSIVEAVGIAGLTTDLEMAQKGSDTTLSGVGEVVLRRVSIDRPLTRAKFDVKQINTHDTSRVAAELMLYRISMKHLEAMLGKEKDAIAAWTGDTGDVGVTLKSVGNGYQANLRPALPNLAGEFDAAVTDEMVTVTAKTSTLTLSKEGLEQRLNAPPAKPAAGEAEEEADATPAAPLKPIKVLADVPMQLVITQLKFPLAMVSDQPFDADAVDINLALSGGPLKVLNPDGVTTSMDDVRLTLNSSNLNDGVAFSLKSKASAEVPPEQLVAATQPASTQPVSLSGSDPAVVAAAAMQPGTLDVTGKLLGLIDAKGLLNTKQPRLQMTAKANSVPTAIADAFTNMQGLLVAAVGPQMNATFVADDFSVNSGQVDGRIDTTNGWLELLLRGRVNALRSPKDKPVNAELAITPALRQRLLQNIHPILADIRTTEQPLRATVANLIMPTNGAIGRLNADLEITIGKVEFDSGSSTLKVLSLFSKKDRGTIPGSIDPIKATIRKGIVKYEKFSVHIDKYRLDYFGEINLVKGTVNLTTQIPLDALAQSVEELRGYADKITVPLVTRGKFGALKTQIDPDFDLGKAALNAGFKGGLEGLLKGKDGGLLGDLLDGLGGKEKPPS